MLIDRKYIRKKSNYAPKTCDGHSCASEACFCKLRHFPEHSFLRQSPGSFRQKMQLRHLFRRCELLVLVTEQKIGCTHCRRLHVHAAHLKSRALCWDSFVRGVRDEEAVEREKSERDYGLCIAAGN
jgi:hypothetical protein